MPQGLGTGLLYTDNVASPLVLRGDGMWFDEAAMGQEGDRLC